jgi:uncharacterized protein with FMN-binding domain
MRRIATWILSTLSVLVLLFGYHTSTSGVASTAPETVISGSAAGAATTGGSTGSGAGAGTASGGTGDSSGSASGTVTGSVVNTRYGPIQVAITTDGSSITDVSVLQYPTGDPRSSQISNAALPRLIQSTLDAQSAQVDMVSGATFTSVGYQQSLQSALDQAGL